MNKLSTVLCTAFLLFIVALCGIAPLTNLYAGDTALLSSSGEAVPRYAVRVGEELALKELRGLTESTVLTRADLISRLEEAGSDPAVLDSCENSECAAEIARSLGLDAVILLGMDSLAAGYDISLSGVLADGQILGPVKDQVFDIRDIDETIAALGNSLAVEAGLIEPPAAAVAEAVEQSDKPSQQVPDEKSAESTEETKDSAPDTEASAQNKGPGEDAVAEQKEEETPAPGYDRGMVLFNSGIGAMQLGNLFSLAGFYLDTMAAGNYYKYTQSGSQAEMDDYYSTYETELLLSKIFRVSGFSLTGAGLGAAGIPLFSSDSLRLSSRGKLRFFGALGAYTAGNMLYLNSLDTFAEYSYNSTKGEYDDYYSDRALGDIPWVILRGSGIAALWGTGTWWLVTAPDQPGKTEAGPGNFWDKVLVGSGLLFFGGGNFFAAMAGIDRSYALYDWYDYIEGSGDVGESYKSYSDYMDSSELMGNLAVASWLTSVACFTAAALFDFPDPFAGSEKSGPSVADALRFTPLPGGGALYVHLEFR